MLSDDLGRSGIFGLFIRRVPANLGLLSGESQLIWIFSWRVPANLPSTWRALEVELRASPKKRTTEFSAKKALTRTPTSVSEP